MTVEPRTGVGARAAQARETAARYAERLESTVLGRLWSRLLEVEFVDRSVALAAKAFVSLFPLLILIAALTPDDFDRLSAGMAVARAQYDGLRRNALYAIGAAPDRLDGAARAVGHAPDQGQIAAPQRALAAVIGELL